MGNVLVLGGSLILTLFVGAAFMDAVFGQPRGAGGQFAPMRTTQLKNLIAFGVLVALLLYLVTIY